MKILSVTIQPPRKTNLIANASVLLESEGFTVKINDLRILRNKQDILWVAFPNYSVQRDRAWEYFPAVELDASLSRQISDAVLAEYAENGVRS